MTKINQDTNLELLNNQERLQKLIAHQHEIIQILMKERLPYIRDLVLIKTPKE